MKALKKILNQSIPLYVNVLIAVILLGVLSAYVYFESQASQSKVNTNQESSVVSFCDMRIVRNNNYEFTHPILLADIPEEDAHLTSLKNQITTFVDQKKQQGMISNASVYLKKFADGGWTSVNPDVPYNPGSLVKIAIMISYYKESEDKPGLLDKKLYFDPKFYKQIPHQTYELNTLVPGQYYTIRELLQRMIIDSDNYSTGLLNMNVNLEIFKKLYADTNQPIPDVHDISYMTNVVDYSKFLRILYNGSYLQKRVSDECLKLLSKSSFNDGMTKYLPKNILVCRKFGEFGLKQEKQWHESGIVYYNDKPYILTIMTKGFDTVKMKETISEISRLVFTTINQQ